MATAPDLQPACGDQAVYRTQRLRAETGEVISVSMRIRWVDAVDHKKFLELQMYRDYGPRPKKLPSAVPIMVPEGQKVNTVSVKVKGQTATAVGIGGSWSIQWNNQDGSGSLFGTVELEELLKVAESLPELK